MPSFGILSGFCTSMGLAPHLLVLALLLIAGINPPVISLIIFSIGAKLLGEWLFWTKAANRMSEQKGSRHIPINQELLSHPNIWISLIMIGLDALSEAKLVFTALKTPTPPTLILFAFLGCQAISAPIQGAISSYFNQKKSLLFALIISMIAVAVSGGVSLDGVPKNLPMHSLINLLYLSPFTPGVQMIFILCAKGLLGNITVIARSAIVEVIKSKRIDAI